MLVKSLPKIQGLEGEKTEEAFRVSAKTTEKRESVKSETPKIHNKPVVPQSKVRGGGWDSVLKQMESSPLFQKQKAQREKEGSEVPNDVTATKRESVKAVLPKVHNKPVAPQNKVGGEGWNDVLKQMESSPLFKQKKAQREKESSEVSHDVVVEKRESIDAMPKAQEKVLPRANKGISTGKVSGALYMDELKQKLAERGKIE